MEITQGNVSKVDWNSNAQATPKNTKNLYTHTHTHTRKGNTTRNDSQQPTTSVELTVRPETDGGKQNGRGNSRG